jgi:Ulp1 family protease
LGDDLLRIDASSKEYFSRLKEMDGTSLIASSGAVSLPVRSILRLQHGQWLCDDVINTYIDLIQGPLRGIHIFNTYFFNGRTEEWTAGHIRVSSLALGGLAKA